MKQFTWKGFNWYSEDHAKSNCKNAYFSEDAFYIDEQDKLHLKLNLCEPKVMRCADNGELRTYHFAAGEVCGEGNWGYGTYECWTSQSVAYHLWSAVWLCGRITWPPEIDIFECYSNQKGYPFYRPYPYYETNIHYGQNTAPMNLGAKKICKWLYKDINYWKLKWTKNYIKIYLNGWLVRCVRNRKVLAEFNKDAKMYPILNMQVRNDFSEADYNYCTYDLTIHDFKYTPIV